jgi:hypothetical protein
MIKYHASDIHVNCHRMTAGPSSSLYDGLQQTLKPPKLCFQKFCYGPPSHNIKPVRVHTNQWTQLSTSRAIPWQSHILHTWSELSWSLREVFRSAQVISPATAILDKLIHTSFSCPYISWALAWVTVTMAVPQIRCCFIFNIVVLENLFTPPAM